jgi:hypothetical protein
LPGTPPKRGDSQEIFDRLWQLSEAVYNATGKRIRELPIRI